MTGEGYEGGISQLRVWSPCGGNAKTLGPHAARHTTHLPFSLCFSSFSFSLQVSPLLGFFLLPLLPQSIPGGPLRFKREKEESSHLLIIICGKVTNIVLVRCWVIPWECFSNFKMPMIMDHLESWLKCRFWSSRSGVGPRILHF